MSSPNVLVNDLPTSSAIEVSPGATFTVKLENIAGVTTWEVVCFATDDENDKDDVNGTFVMVDLPNRIATFEAPVDPGSAMLFRSTINGGVDSNGRTRTDWVTTFKVYTEINGLELAALNETTESGPTGWLALFNNLIRSGTAGGAPADASFLVLGANPTLTLERIFNPTTGLWVSDGGAGGNYTVKVNDAVVPFLSQSNTWTGPNRFSAPLTASAGISASFYQMGNLGTGAQPNSGLLRTPYNGAVSSPIWRTLDSGGTERDVVRYFGDGWTFGNAAQNWDMTSFQSTFTNTVVGFDHYAPDFEWYGYPSSNRYFSVTSTRGLFEVPLSASMGISGSLTRVGPNLPYLLTQGAITALTNSFGQIILSASGGSGGGGGLTEPVTASLGISASFLQLNGSPYNSANIRVKYAGSQNILQAERTPDTEIWQNVISRSSSALTVGDTTWWNLNLYSFNVDLWGAGAGGGINIYNQPGTEIARVRDRGIHFGSAPVVAPPAEAVAWFSGSSGTVTAADKKVTVFAGDVVSSASISFAGVGNGTSPATGLLRIPYNAAATVPVVKVLDSTATEKNGFRWGPGDAFYIGDSSRSADLHLFGGSCNQNVVTMLFTVGAGGFKIEDFSSVGYFFGGGATGKVDQRLYLSSSNGVLSGSEKYRVVMGDTIFSGTVVEQIINNRNKKWSYFFETSTTSATPKQIFQWPLPSGSSRVTVTADYCRADVSSVGSFTKATIFRNNAGTVTQETVVGGIDGGTLVTSGSGNGLSIDFNGTTARLYLTGTTSSTDTWQIDMLVNEIKPA